MNETQTQIAVEVSTKTGGVCRMDEVTHAQIMETGCDPHCHACLRKIEHGDLYSMKVFDTGLEHMLVPAMFGDMGKLQIRGSCCERCTHEDRPLAPGEKAAILDRFRLREAALVDPPAQKAGLYKGCFMLPDGRMF